MFCLVFSTLFHWNYGQLELRSGLNSVTSLERSIGMKALGYRQKNKGFEVVRIAEFRWKRDSQTA